MTIQRLADFNGHSKNELLLLPFKTADIRFRKIGGNAAKVLMVKNV
jgi:hypothetical protein